MDHENDIAYCSVLARSVKPLTYAKFFETIVKQDISKVYHLMLTANKHKTLVQTGE